MKPFLKRVYVDFYRRMGRALGPFSGQDWVMELGSGEHGFIRQVLPRVWTSESHNSLHGLVCNAEKIHFAPGCIKGLLMLNVLHHIRPYKFLREASRVLRPSGRVVMIEPANTLWSRFIYRHFHRAEDFDPEGELDPGNNAMAWIVFEQRRWFFDKAYPDLRIVSQELHTPLAYTLSGGNGRRYGLPGFLYPIIKAVEWLLTPFNRWLAMFQTIVLERIADSPKEAL